MSSLVQARWPVTFQACLLFIRRKMMISTQPRDRRKRKTSKLKQRSQSHRENMIKLEHDAGVQKADSSSSKEDMKSVEQGSSTASTSSSMKTESFTLISPQSQPPFTSSLSKQSPRTTFHPSAAKNIVNLPSSPSISKRSPRTEYHPSSAKNIVNPLPPRPPSKILASDRNTQGLDVMHPRYGLEKRPASMSDVGRAAREQLLNNYGPDD